MDVYDLLIQAFTGWPGINKIDKIDGNKARIEFTPYINTQAMERQLKRYSVERIASDPYRGRVEFISKEFNEYVMFEYYNPNIWIVSASE